MVLLPHLVGDIFAPVLTLMQPIPKKLAEELRLVPEPPPQAVKGRERSKPATAAAEPA